jgi:hypothetical protein
MRARDVTGKRIVGIRQRVINARDYGKAMMVADVLAIVLEDGTELRPIAGETDFDFYTVDFVVHKPEKETETK